MKAPDWEKVHWKIWLPVIGLVSIIGLLIVAAGASALLGLTPSANAVASAPSTAGVVQTFALPAGNFALSWKTWGPSDPASFSWEIVFLVTNETDTPVAHGNRRWSESTSCTTDSDGIESCTNPGEFVLARFSGPAGNYTLRLNVISSTSSAPAGQFGAHIFLSDPAQFEGRNWATVWWGVAVAFLWAPIFASYLWLRRNILWGRDSGADGSDIVTLGREPFGPEPANPEPAGTSMIPPPGFGGAAGPSPQRRTALPRIVQEAESSSTSSSAPQGEGGA